MSIKIHLLVNLLNHLLIYLRTCLSIIFTYLLVAPFLSLSLSFLLSIQIYQSPSICNFLYPFSYKYLSYLYVSQLFLPLLSTFHYFKGFPGVPNAADSCVGSFLPAIASYLPFCLVFSFLFLFLPQTRL